MPTRLANVRVSIRAMTETKDGNWKTPVKSWAHVRYQRMLTLAPISGRESLKEGRALNEALWAASARDKPVIKDTDRIVTLDATGADALVLEVLKVQPRGPRQELLLRLTGEQQPA